MKTHFQNLVKQPMWSNLLKHLEVGRLVPLTGVIPPLVCYGSLLIITQLRIYRELYTKKVTADNFARQVLMLENNEYIHRGVLTQYWAKRGDVGPKLQRL